MIQEERELCSRCQWLLVPLVVLPGSSDPELPDNHYEIGVWHLDEEVDHEVAASEEDGVAPDRLCAHITILPT